MSPVLRGRISSLHLLGILCLMQLRRWSVVFAARVMNCLAHVQHGNPQDPQVLFCQHHFQLVTPQVLFLVNFMGFLSAHFCSLLSSLKRAKWPSDYLEGHPHLVSSANLPRVHSVPSFRSLMKLLNCKINVPWGSVHLSVCSSSLFFTSFSIRILW